MSAKEVTQKEIDEARKKFGEMYSNVKLGGKGKIFFYLIYNIFIRNPEEKKIRSK
jgi:hypothetical protein